MIAQIMSSTSWKMLLGVSLGYVGGQWFSEGKVTIFLIRKGNFLKYYFGAGTLGICLFMREKSEE